MSEPLTGAEIRLPEARSRRLNSQRGLLWMLSIGKLKAGQARYYLNQADARVDVIDSVADGMEDYYVGALEARGEWIGSAGLELGLAGAVEADGLRRILAGLDPRDGSSLRDTTSRVRVAGFDLTFSAPKRWHELRDLVRSAGNAALQLQSREPEEVPRCGW